MKTIIVILLSLIAAISLAAAYTPEQQVAIDGSRLSFQLGQAYEKFLQGGDASGFNALVDQWNAWVVKNFGQDANLLMQKATGPVNLQAPYILANNTTQGGIVHAIDGSTAPGASYTTNDANLLPESARDQLMGAEGTGDKKVYTNPGAVDYLGGV